MRVLVLGGYGLIGSAVVARLLAAEHEVVAVARDVAAARVRYPEVMWLEKNIAALASPSDWHPILDGIDAVVNCAGALQDGPRDDVRAVQFEAMVALFQACEQKLVRLFVQISAAGAEVGAATAFMRTKAEADDALRRSTLEWVILRPGLVLAPTAYGGTALLRALASFPLVTLSVLEDRPIQTVHVDDVANAVLMALEGRVPARSSYDLVEDCAHAFADVVAAFCAWLGRPAARKVRMARSLASLAFRIGDGLGALGWRSPLRTTALRQIEAGVTGDPTAWTRATGHALPGLVANLRRIPSTVQERWFGRLWLMKPVVITTLSAFWIASGVIGILRLDAAASILTGDGWSTTPAITAVVAGSVVDIALGAAVLIRRAMPAAALGMVLVSAGYLLAATLIVPHLWLDPLGPLVKTIPAAVLALVALAVAEER
jgi:uncharacterized protein YbjT (DUF2867 family)